MSKFAKRHYEAIAEAMQEACPRSREPDLSAREQQWRFTVEALADTFAGDNGMFKRDRFERACQPGANVRARS